MKLSEVIAESGDSVLESFHFDGVSLVVHLRLGEDEETVVLFVPTRSLRSEWPAKADDVHRNCFLEFKQANQVLKTENGRYIPSQTFPSLMEEIRQGANLAYGEKANVSAGIFSVRGYSRLLVCYLENPDDVIIQFKQRQN